MLETLKKLRWNFVFGGKGNVGFIISKFLPFFISTFKETSKETHNLCLKHKKKLRCKLNLFLGERELHGLNDLKSPFVLFFIST
jgi:hypothetical protein